MAWLSNSLTNLKVQLNSLMKDEEEYRSDTSAKNDERESLDKRFDCTIAENINENVKCGTSFHQETCEYRTSLQQFLNHFDDCLKDVSSLNSSLNYFAEQTTDIFDQVDYLRFELKNVKYRNHSSVELQNVHRCTVLESDDDSFNVKYPLVAEMNSKSLPTMTSKVTGRSSECRSVETSINNEFFGDNFCSIDFTKQVENLILAFETAHEKQCDMEKQMRATLSNVCSVEALEPLFVDYFVCVNDSYAVWEKLKLMFVLPAIAKFKNAKISELSVPDSVKEVFQPNFTSVDHSSLIHRQVRKSDLDTGENMDVISPTKLATKLKDDATATNENKCTAQEEFVSTELSRLRSHLLSVEQAYTNELLQCEDEINILRTQLRDSEQKLNSMSQSYTSMNVRTNQIIESLQSDVKRFAENNENLEAQLKNCQAELRRNLNDSQNLRLALDLFYKNKDSEIFQATEKLQSEMRTVQRENDELHEAIRTLRHTLSNCKETSNVATNVKIEFEKKEKEIDFLKSEVLRLEAQLRHAETKITELTSDVEVKIKINLIKNVVFRYITSHSSTTKLQSLRILANVLDFNDYEKCKVGLSKSGFEKMIHNDQTLIGEFIKFMEKESCPKVEKRMEKVESNVYSSPVSHPTPNTSHMSNCTASSSILKDALRSNDT